MPILNYTTSIDSDRTITEINKCLAAHGAKKVIVDYDDSGIAIGVTFQLLINDNFVAFSLPANYQGVLRAMQKNKRIPKKLQCKEQALRVSWRILKDWIEAQMAIVEAELAEMAEVFLPYAVTKSGHTLYNSMKNNMNLLTSGGDQ